MGCLTRTTGRIINERCDVCEHSLHWHNILYDAVNHVAPMPEDGWPCLACDWEARIRALESREPPVPLKGAASQTRGVGTVRGYGRAERRVKRDPEPGHGSRAVSAPLVRAAEAPAGQGGVGTAFPQAGR